MLAQHKMLGKSKINHFEFGRCFRGRKQKVFELQIAMNDTLGMKIPHRRQHLLDESRTLRFCIVKVGLYIETIKQIATVTEFLHNIDFVGAFVHLLDADDIRVVQLTLKKRDSKRQ
jgi:hypothetical protein